MLPGRVRLSGSELWDRWEKCYQQTATHTQESGVTSRVVLLHRQSYHHLNKTHRDRWWFTVPSVGMRIWVTALTLDEMEGNAMKRNLMISCDRRGWKSLCVLWLHAPLSVHICNLVWGGCCDRNGCFISRLLRRCMHINPDLDGEIIQRISVQLHCFVVINWYVFIEKMIDAM